MSTYHLEIITRDKVFFEGEVNRIVARGVEGDFAILANHTPFVTFLKIAPLKIYDPQKEIKEISISSGIIKVADNHVTILADAAEWPGDIDVERAEEAKKRAKDRLEKKNQYDYARADAALKRALMRLNVSDKK